MLRNKARFMFSSCRHCFQSKCKNKHLLVLLQPLLADSSSSVAAQVSHPKTSPESEVLSVCLFSLVVMYVGGRYQTAHAATHRSALYQCLSHHIKL